MWLLNDKQLKSIAITTNDNEVLAVIFNDGSNDIVQKEGVLVRFNYTDEEYVLEIRGSKVYLKEWYRWQKFHIQESLNIF